LARRSGKQGAITPYVFYQGRCHSLAKRTQIANIVMKKNNFYYFKKALILIIPITVFVIIRDLFEVEFFNFSEILKLVAKGVFVGVFTGIILGIINIFAKIKTFMK